MPKFRALSDEEYYQRVRRNEQRKAAQARHALSALSTLGEVHQALQLLVREAGAAAVRREVYRAAAKCASQQRVGDYDFATRLLSTMLGRRWHLDLNLAQLDKKTRATITKLAKRAEHKARTHYTQIRW